MARTLVKSTAGAAAAGLAAGLATIAGEIVYVANRDYPEHPDLDASGHIGARGRPAVDVVVVGDSTCTGPGLDNPDQIWIRQLMSRFDGRSFRVESLAAGGSRAGDVIADQLPAAMTRPRDIAVVSVGANDALHGHSLLGLQADLAAIVDALLDRSQSVILTGVGDVGSAPRIPFPLSATASAFCRGADRVHRNVARGRTRVFKASMWETTTASFRARDDLWTTDFYHPNEAGHALWADAVHQSFAAALLEVDRTGADQGVC